MPDGVFFENSDGDLRSVPPTPSAHCARSREAGPAAHPPPAQKACGGVGVNGRRRLDAPAQSVPASPIGKSGTNDGRTSQFAYLRRRIFAPRWGLCLRTGRRLTRTTRSLLRSSTAFTASNRRGPGRPDPFRVKHAAPGAPRRLHLSPTQFLDRIAALIPPPRSHLVRYHGVFAPHSKHCERIVPSPPPLPLITPAAPSVPPLSTHAAAWFQTRLGVASAPSPRERCASLRSLLRSSPAPVHDHGGQDRPENSQPPWPAIPGPLPIPRPSPPTHPRSNRLERSSRGRSNPIELVELSSPPPNTANLSNLANEPAAIGLSVDPSQT